VETQQVVHVEAEARSRSEEIEGMVRAVPIVMVKERRQAS
jgi:hypothetical protein